MLVPTVYAVYLLISVALVVGVARAIRVQANPPLVVGFCLVNLGYALAATSFGPGPEDLRQAIEYLGIEIGLLMLVLGVTHLGTMRMNHAAEPAAAERVPKPGLRAELDLPIRVVLWAVVIVVALVALEPTFLYLPGSPLVGMLAIGIYLAGAHLAIRLTLGAVDRSASSALSFRLFGHGATLLLGGIGPLPLDLVGAMTYVTFRLGVVLLGLGLSVAIVLRLRLPGEPGLPREAC